MNAPGAEASPTRVSSATRRNADHPGLLPFIATALGSAVLCAYWLMGQPAASPNDAAASAVSLLTEVWPQDLPDALGTINSALRDRFTDHEGKCGLPLASITVTGSPGQSPGSIRIISGRYYSPLYPLSDAPMRMAIPYPAPYEAGHGTLTILHTGGNVAVALEPPLHLTAQANSAARAVTWVPARRCPGG